MTPPDATFFIRLRIEHSSKLKTSTRQSGAFADLPPAGGPTPFFLVNKQHNLKLFSIVTIKMNIGVAPVPSQATAVSEQQKENATMAAARLIGMNKNQLQEEMTMRGLYFPKSITKDGMLEKLGIPANQWKKWRKMTGNDLKQELATKSLKTTGSKQVLLERLGVPTGFGESNHETVMRESNEVLKKRKALQKVLQKKKSKVLCPSDDPNHEEYTLKCCSTPREADGEPAGFILFRDGSLMEVWRCMNCNQIPARPNAPPIQETSDHADDDDDKRGFGF
jgi:hypothetical protein